MSNPTVLSVSPVNAATDVILGQAIVVTFSSLMDPSTITNATFSLTGPAQTQILTPQQLISSDPSYITGRNTINGVFTTTTNSSNQTVLTFTPNVSLQPNSLYTVLLIGSGALLVGSTIGDTSGNPLASNYQWSFTTGDLNTSLPPIQAPLPYQYASIDPASIKVRVNGQNPGDLLNEPIASGFSVDLIFPADLDTTSFDPTDLYVSLEQFLGDPTVPMPMGLSTIITVTGNTINILIS
jgi:hypothetical protein